MKKYIIIFLSFFLSTSISSENFLKRHNFGFSASDIPLIKNEDPRYTINYRHWFKNGFGISTGIFPIISDVDRNIFLEVNFFKSLRSDKYTNLFTYSGVSYHNIYGMDSYYDNISTDSDDVLIQVYTTELGIGSEIINNIINLSIKLGYKFEYKHIYLQNLITKKGRDKKSINTHLSIGASIYYSFGEYK